ncbi:DUF5995 family protein [Paraglaciecola aquimarina]|uniref:DUF5995 family protein n=1 Tax=Paraglaciecola algarum TaxID=3050085 RepID=A0ABS9DAJ7_9ALTE|nr:DUF5995 family protein [Paraglaciecola sp. G1-23]MCF2949410.1 DUF5995 family protein [Paraglaciecola sp. G1-23]
MVKAAETIDQVIEQLTDIVQWAKVHKSRAGYFAALYCKVTIRVKEGIEQGEFENAERMERLDVIFANRYIQAFYQDQNGAKPTKSWQRAFEVSDNWWPIVLQHLLLGMNAHINLDLGIAAAQTYPEDELPLLQEDFNRINQVLASLVNGVQNDLAEIWPILGFFNRNLGNLQKSVINFSMEKARDAAWEFAESLAPLSEPEQQPLILLKDQQMADFSRVIRFPGFTGTAITKLIRIGERGDVVSKINVLI